MLVVLQVALSCCTTPPSALAAGCHSAANWQPAPHQLMAAAVAATVVAAAAVAAAAVAAAAVAVAAAAVAALLVSHIGEGRK